MIFSFKKNIFIMYILFSKTKNNLKIRYSISFFGTWVAVKKIFRWGSSMLIRGMVNHDSAHMISVNIKFIIK